MAAQEYHDRLKAECWRAEKMGEGYQRALNEAALQMLKLSEGQSDYSTKVRHIRYWRDALGGDTPLTSLSAGGSCRPCQRTRRTPTGNSHRCRPRPRTATSLPSGAR